MASKRTRVTLVRHGETAFNHANRYMGRMEESLNATGREQAARAARRLASEGGADALYSSPLRRTRETAGFMEESLGLEARIEDAFLEMDLGPWEGRDRSEIAAQDPARWRLWLTDPSRVHVPGMEPVEAVRRRVGVALDHLVGSHAGDHVVVVTHFACVVTAVLHALDLPTAAYRRFPVDNASVTVLRCSDLNKLVRFNGTSHLAGPPGSPPGRG